MKILDIALSIIDGDDAGIYEKYLQEGCIKEVFPEHDPYLTMCEWRECDPCPMEMEDEISSK